MALSPVAHHWREWSGRTDTVDLAGIPVLAQDEGEDSIMANRAEDPSSSRMRATPDDLYARLGTIIGLMERQNTMIYNIGLNAIENADFWHEQNRT